MYLLIKKGAVISRPKQCIVYRPDLLSGSFSERLFSASAFAEITQQIADLLNAQAIQFLKAMTVFYEQERLKVAIPERRQFLKGGVIGHVKINLVV